MVASSSTIINYIGYDHLNVDHHNDRNVGNYNVGIIRYKIKRNKKAMYIGTMFFSNSNGWGIFMGKADDGQQQRNEYDHFESCFIHSFLCFAVNDHSRWSTAIWLTAGCCCCCRHCCFNCLTNSWNRLSLNHSTTPTPFLMIPGNSKSCVMDQMESLSSHRSITKLPDQRKTRRI